MMMQTPHLLINKPPKVALKKDKRSLLVCKRRLMKEKEASASREGKRDI